MKTFGQVKIIFGDGDSDNPRCPHGPSLLMERGDQRFYACSAYRNRRDCDFYHVAGEKLSQAKVFRLSQAGKALLQGRDHQHMFHTLQTVVKEKDSVEFCRSCGGLVRKEGEDGEECCKEANPATITQEQATKPSGILQPKARDKKEAQYFFSPATSTFLSNTVSSLGFTDILCIGCPSVFELLPSHLNCLLLDLDPRFQAFYSPEKFLWYNFFNGHVFHGDKPKTVLQNFLISSEKLLIILDPPFGAKTDLIAHSLNRIKAQVENLSFSAKVSTVWVFPYFMERQMAASCPALAMADYRVTYSNHKEFGGDGEGRKQGSPVRIFTDISLSDLELPASDGYKRCEPCDRWVAKENIHCQFCKSCPSKDGRTYVHCVSCGRCVKPTYTHCSTCHRCKLPTHTCGKAKEEEDEEVELPLAPPGKRKKLSKAKNMSLSYKKKMKKK
jgi:hypothetical protein